MKYSKSLIFVAIALVLGAISLTFFLSDGEDVKINSEERVVRDKRITRNGSTKSAQRSKRTARVRVKSVVKDREKPTFDLADEEEAKLTAEQRLILAEIRKALDEDDRETVLRLVQKLQQSKEWPDGIPKAIKMATIDALGWFGSSCLPELAGFLGDGDQEVLQAAVEKYEEALSDIDLSDRERSVILVQASKVITDSEAMDMMLFELNNMRHSVAVDTIKQLMSVAGDATKEVLPDNVEFYTGEEDMNTPEKLDQWLKENPDDPDDDDFYGGSNS